MIVFSVGEPIRASAIIENGQWMVIDMRERPNVVRAKGQCETDYAAHVAALTAVHATVGGFDLPEAIAQVPT